MTIREMLKKTFYSTSEENFSSIVEEMKRKSSKGLLKESPDEIEEEVNSIFALDEMYQMLDEEADEAIERFSTLEETILTEVEEVRRISIVIWERKFSLPVIFDCYAGEKPTEKQEKAVETFLQNPSWIDNAKSPLEKYCKKSLDEDKTNLGKDNIFSYVKPDYIYVKRDEDRPFSRLSIMLKYKYDPGHGLAVIFGGKGSIKVASQDEIL